MEALKALPPLPALPPLSGDKLALPPLDDGAAPKRKRSRACMKRPASKMKMDKGSQELHDEGADGHPQDGESQDGHLHDGESQDGRPQGESQDGRLQDGESQGDDEESEHDDGRTQKAVLKRPAAAGPAGHAHQHIKRQVLRYP